jgi:hypothetical protein
MFIISTVTKVVAKESASARDFCKPQSPAKTRVSQKVQKLGLLQLHRVEF